MITPSNGEMTAINSPKYRDALPYIPSTLTTLEIIPSSFMHSTTTRTYDQISGGVMLTPIQTLQLSARFLYNLLATFT